MTPTVNERPESLDKDTVVLSVAQNGQNFNENESACDYTFTGTGEAASFWPWIIALVLIFILLIILLLCIAAIFQLRHKGKGRKPIGATYDREAPHVLNKRPRGVPTGPMEYDYSRKTDYIGGVDNRQSWRGNDPYDTRGKCSISCQLSLTWG